MITARVVISQIMLSTRLVQWFDTDITALNTLGQLISGAAKFISRHVHFKW